VFICGPVLLVTLFTSTGAIAQRGGKAEPNRIEFKRGTHSTTISGTVRGDEQAEYVLAAKKGQRLVIKLTSVRLSRLSSNCSVRITTRWDWNTMRTTIIQECYQRPVSI